MKLNALRFILTLLLICPNYCGWLISVTLKLHYVSLSLSIIYLSIYLSVYPPSHASRHGFSPVFHQGKEKLTFSMDNGRQTCPKASGGGLLIFGYIFEKDTLFAPSSLLTIDAYLSVLSVVWFVRLQLI